MFGARSQTYAYFMHSDLMYFLYLDPGPTHKHRHLNELIGNAIFKLTLPNTLERILIRVKLLFLNFKEW